MSREFPHRPARFPADVTCRQSVSRAANTSAKSHANGSALPLPLTRAHVLSRRREHDAAVLPVLTLRARPLRIALVGQPNVGKSVVFGRLTGRYVTVSNYPGTTVAITTGRALVGAEVCDVIDTPGVNALEGDVSEDERITRDVLASNGADLVVQVADARNLRRALMLTAQIAAFGKPIVLALNMIDEAFARGISIDAARAVGRCSASRSSRWSRSTARASPNCATALAARRRARRAGRPDAARARGLGQRPDAARAAHQHAVAARGFRRCWRAPRGGRSPACRFSRVVLYALYLFVGVFGAQTLVKLLEDGAVRPRHQPGGDLAGRSLHPDCRSSATSSSASTA